MMFFFSENNSNSPIWWEVKKNIVGIKRLLGTVLLSIRIQSAQWPTTSPSSLLDMVAASIDWEAKKSPTHKIAINNGTL